MSRSVGREAPIRGQPTFFQQKWAAKSKTRGYHGEHVPEKKWVRLFSRRLLSAVDMPPKYLALHDGSEQATGRGSGRTNSTLTAESFSAEATPMRSLRHPPTTNHLLESHVSKMTPYMQMTFAPMERRLDTAIFRALFASSVRQARQFIIHGAVTVNGKKMVHPSYQLNPGDMFQVEVDKVLYATGQQKTPSSDKRLIENLEAREKRAAKLESDFVMNSSAAKANADAAAASIEAAVNAEEANAEEGEAETKSETETAEAQTLGVESLTPEESWRLNNKSLKVLLKDIKKMLKNTPETLSAKDKKVLRLFRADAKRFLSHPESSNMGAKQMVDALKAQMETHESMREAFEGLSISADASPKETTPPAAAEKPQNKDRELGKGLAELNAEQKQKAVRIIGDSQLTREEMRSLARMLQLEEENPVDHTKPYATPWQPRPYMSAFAFIPRYLEVNQNICAAVYLRHPVARKGLAEVPTPFSYITNQLTHNWYLQRG